jgi:trimethylamine-N-oxide reductase (cytochrome c)
VKSPLPTPSGLLKRIIGLKDNFPDDKERPPVAHWIHGGKIEDGWYHDEYLDGERIKEYPLQLVSNTPKWRYHGQHDDIPWMREEAKIEGPDGYWYEQIWINPVDAAARGIKTGDIVKVYNERGTVLNAARVVEKSAQGVVVTDHGSRPDFIIPGQVDRGGSHNLINPDRPISHNCDGSNPTGFWSS